MVKYCWFFLCVVVVNLSSWIDFVLNKTTDYICTYSTNIKAFLYHIWQDTWKVKYIFWCMIALLYFIYILGVQISSVRFSKDGSSCCEWWQFIVTVDFGGFREVNHLLIIFSLYRFEFHTKTLIFTVFVMLNFVLIKQHLREVDFLL